MKILYVFGGIPPYANSLLNKLAAKEVEITVVIPHKKSSMIGKGVKMIGEDAANYKIITSEEGKSILNKEYFKHLPQIIEKEKPDIFVAGWPFFLQYFTQPKLRKALKNNKTKFVMREIPFQVPPYGKLKSFYKENPIFDEDMNLKNKGLIFFIRQWLISKIRKYCYLKADGAVVYSSLGKKILPTYGISEDKVFVTYNANNSDELFRIKQELYDDLPILPKNDQRIIHIGRLVKWKRVDILIDAFSKILPEFPKAELIIVGDGPELENLKIQAQGLNTDNHIIFTQGIYDNKQIGKYFSASTVYVLAGMGGLSINDAMTFGLPIVCSVCDGTERDLVYEGVNGLYFKENDPEDLSKKLLLLFKNPDLRRKMGERSLEIIKNKVNLDTVSDRYIEAYDTILSK